MTTIIPLSTLLQSFFIDRLMKQRQASPHTIASYRDTFRLLLEFAYQRLRKPPSKLAFDDLTEPFVGAFLDHIQSDRLNSTRTRNLRLTAIRSFFHYAAFQEPSRSAHIQRVLAIPTKRQDRPLIDFLTHPEIEALLTAPDKTTWTGRRDQALLVLAIQTGLRLSELIGIRRRDIVLSSGAHVRCYGKGRKERCTPLTKQTVAIMKIWLEELAGANNDVVFPNARGTQLSSDGVQYLLAKHVTTARETCPSLKDKRVSPHVLRHTAAMELLQAGVDHSVIALWLGHESPETTMIYLHADLAYKEKIMDKTKPLNVKAGRYRPDDKLLQFLSGL
ncbi:integrase [Desulfopila sp. IMCC35006]|uniref:site-specific integrase n=1 Tax=Desulfopila sp. IMCC35006 TaxID=2569542 RepID=UPI0010AC19F6|nr:site-specific integrase [Desulfopila sp. IMCC35006]TKB23084.1 integrase [Desulfopila sp. IMCC35006]